MSPISRHRPRHNGTRDACTQYRLLLYTQQRSILSIPGVPRDVPRSHTAILAFSVSNAPVERILSRITFILKRWTLIKGRQLRTEYSSVSLRKIRLRFCGEKERESMTKKFAHRKVEMCKRLIELGGKKREREREEDRILFWFESKEYSRWIIVKLFLNGTERDPVILKLTNVLKSYRTEGWNALFPSKREASRVKRSGQLNEFDEEGNKTFFSTRHA